MKVLVTGVAGFIGSSIAHKLLDRGYDVCGIDSITDYYDPALKKSNLSRLDARRFHFVESDINTTELSGLLEDVQVVIHQAGQPGVRKSWGRDFEDYMDSNVRATQKLLESVKESNSVKKFIYASSSSLYGNAETYPTTETAVPLPRSPYGVTKLAAEHLCGVYAQNYGVNTIALRYFTVYGPRQRPDMAFTRFCKAAATGGKITVYGDGKQIRDFTYIDDVVAANIAAIYADTKPGTVMNIAGGSSVSVNDVLALIQQFAPSDLNVDYIGSALGDVFRTGGDTSRAREVLDWRPAVTLEEGLRSQYLWAKENFV
jgi:nucleoside-diphosphate-sugar epimerase